MAKASKEFKRRKISIARSLGYVGRFPDIEERIKKAETETQVERVLTSARQAM